VKPFILPGANLTKLQSEIDFIINSIEIPKQGIIKHFPGICFIYPSTSACCIQDIPIFCYFCADLINPKLSEF
jgi:hypothetical protein